jgi:hypothetical protein
MGGIQAHVGIILSFYGGYFKRERKNSSSSPYYDFSGITSHKGAKFTEK